MNAFIRTAAFATLTLIGVSSSFAISNLPECYDKVIAACNKGSHPSSCAEGGMNQCDKQFPKPMIYKPELGLSAATEQARPQSTPTPSTILVLPR
jgi:hypothetical protein